MISRKTISISFALVSIITIIRLLFIGNTMLIDDEAYYAIYSHHLDWGYIDHGPVVAYIIYFFTFLIENSFTVRLGGIVLLTTLCYFLYQFGKVFYDKKTGIILALTVCINMLFHTNAVVITPDAPLSFFSILTIIYYYKSYFKDENYLILAGLFLGLSMLSKVSALFIAIGIFIFPIAIKEKQHLLKNIKFYYSFLIAFIVFLPFIIWNLQNELAFVKYQGNHILGKGNFQTFSELWLGLFILCGPILFYYTVTIPIRYLINIKNISNEKIYFCFVTGFPLLYFLIHSSFSRMELNWPAPVFMGGIFLFAIHVSENWKRLKKQFIFQLLFSLFLIIVVTTQTFYPILSLNKKADITNRYYKYQSIIYDLSEYLNNFPELKEKRILSNNFQIPSIINFYLKPKLEAGCLSIGYHETLYSFLYPDKKYIGDNFLYLSKSSQFPNKIKPYFSNIKLIKQFSSKRDSKIISEFSLWEANGYSGKQ